MRKTYEEKALHNELADVLFSVGSVEGRIVNVGFGYDLADRCVTLGVVVEHATSKDEDLLIGTIALFASNLFDLPIEQLKSRLDQNLETGFQVLSISFKHSNAFTVISRNAVKMNNQPQTNNIKAKRS